MTFDALAQRYEETMARARRRAAALDDAVEALADTDTERSGSAAAEATAGRRLLDALRADLDR
jgi:hypothetical protein